MERKNAQLKHTRFESLDDAGKRPTRGYTPHALQVAMLVVAHNVRTIDNYLRTAEGIDTKKSTRRQSRRSGEEKIGGIRKQLDGRSAASPAHTQKARPRQQKLHPAGLLLFEI